MNFNTFFQRFFREDKGKKKVSENRDGQNIQEKYQEWERKRQVKNDLEIFLLIASKTYLLYSKP